MGRTLWLTEGRRRRAQGLLAAVIALCPAMLACGSAGAVYPARSTASFMRACERAAALATCACVVRGMEAAKRPVADLRLADAVLAGREAPPPWLAHADRGC